MARAKPTSRFSVWGRQYPTLTAALSYAQTVVCRGDVDTLDVREAPTEKIVGRVYRVEERIITTTE